ncbi:DUF3943 domain-containing protein [Glaciecola sp. KUL10]|uniref:DUF3943 domain-containing protein n=1 Tax=Glaciecola sp. (strain KUL10) TaxID=2161813 RepID=UPI000D78A801|nr:DUF3943 domain-containing protein [Glaciecola sp. KUL10]GBL04703.1 hypothetical protein KUL10_20120 [Glaciecola sp. KUL10]
MDLRDFKVCLLACFSMFVFSRVAIAQDQTFQTSAPVHSPSTLFLIELEENTNTDKRATTKNWNAAMYELGSILFLGKAAYLAGGDTITRDFDYELEGNELEYFHDRLFTKEYLKLDDNTKGMNWGHAYAGMIYHQAFRNHNFSFYESTLATIATSTAWEVLFEYKEVVSINDQVFTPYGGIVLGESFFQISELLETKEGWIPSAFGILFNPAKSIRSWMGYQQAPRFSRSNTVDVFDVYAGYTNSHHANRARNSQILTLGITTSVDSRKGNYDSFKYTPTLVEVVSEFGFSSEGFEDFRLHSQVLLGGYYYQSSDFDNPRFSKPSKTEKASAANIRHSAWEKQVFLGPSMGIEYNSMGADRDTQDFYATANLIGLDGGLALRKINVDHKAIELRFRANAFVDFAMVKPFADNAIENVRDFYWNTKSSLWENAYAYALGHTAFASFELNYQQWALGLHAKMHRWDSIDNKKIERFRDWNPNVKDLDLKDKRDILKLMISYAPSSAWKISINFEKIHRSGKMIGIDQPDFFAQASDTETRTSVIASYRY